jgi:hypothetical protein
MFFDWIRARSRDAVLAGVADAVRDLESTDGDHAGREQAGKLLLNRLATPVSMIEMAPDKKAKAKA